MNILRQLLLLASFFSILCGTACATILNDTMKVVIIAGQSQTGAQFSSADSLPPEYRTQAPDVLLWRADLDKPYAYFPGPNRVEYNTQFSGFDWAYIFAKKYTAQNGGRMLVIKHSYGGTKLGSNSLAGGISWLPVENELYAELRNEWRAAKKYYEARGVYLKVELVIWGQGEADASVQALSNTYEANLNTLIDALNAEIAQAAHWILSLLKTNAGTPPYPGTGATRCCDIQVRNAITTVATQRGYSTIDLDLYANPAGTDTTHLGEIAEDVGADIFTIVTNRQQ